jgi:hypothetical protein
VTVGRRLVRGVVVWGVVAAAVLCVRSSAVGASGASVDRVAPDEIKLVSDFRVDAGWTRMWTDWRPDLVAADLARVASLRANTVRVIVEPGLFGYPHPRASYVSRLREFVSLAAQHRLRVQLTLFDWWYEWGDVRNSQAWARELLAPYVGDQRIACIELKNELVLKPHTIAWARAMIPFIRSLLGARTPVTLSVSGTDPVERLARLKRGLGSVRPDVFDIHYFGGGGELAYSVFSKAKAVAAPTPLRVGETGYPTTKTLSGYGGVPRTPSGQEAAQAHFFASVAWAARAAGLPPVGVWVLNDLDPSAVPDRTVVDDDPELHYGLYRTDGSAKPAAAVVRAAFSGEAPLAFNNGFEDAVETEAGAAVPARWSMQGEHVAFAADRLVRKEGAASASITPAAVGSGSLSITPPNGGVRGGERVTLGVWVRKTDAPGRVFAVIEWFDNADRRLARAASAVLTRGSPNWRRVRLAARAPRRAAYLRIDLVGRELASPLWFDEVSFGKR